MSLFYSSINSGSNGNCYFVGNENNAVLIDIGIYARDLEKRLTRLKIPIERIKALFITHEHSDHIRGVVSFASKYNLPVFLTQGTWNKMKDQMKTVTYRFIVDDNPIIIDDLLIFPFTKIHDASAPISFVIEHQKTRVGVMTDLGKVCENVKSYFSTCHAVFLEANYDPDMLMKGNYPPVLKQRIKGGKGHLSNQQALELFLNFRNPQLKHLMLAHISEENNDTEIIYEMFLPHANQTRITVAQRYSETGIFKVNAKKKLKSVHSVLPVAQLSLF